jgi:glycolate dehydrogenase FAD-binding subunit
VGSSKNIPGAEPRCSQRQTLMTAVADILPLTETFAPPDQAALAAVMAEAYTSGTAMYPIGGGTSLDYGLAASQPGIGIATSGLVRTIDYPARDMTITVEAGVTMGQLAATLAAERQWLPVDVPHHEAATLGGVVATAFSGPRRYGFGTMRDYVIGISAVDGRGTAFKAGGRVVKNVAGYDFCKLLTGSLGTLGVITQLTLKIKPLPELSAFLVGDLRDWATAEQLLAALVTSGTTPSAIELLVGEHWRENAALGLLTAGSRGRLAVGLEGTAAEVDWMLRRLAAEWRDLGLTATRAIHGEHAGALWRDLNEFPSATDAPLVLKASVSPSRTVEFVQHVLKLDPQASIAAHAGNGIVIARFANFEAGEVTRGLIGRLQPAAQLTGGHAIVLSSTLVGLTRQAVWGGVGSDTAWMGKVKAQFDPKGLLNPGRFVYASA